MKNLAKNLYILLGIFFLFVSCNKGESSFAIEFDSRIKYESDEYGFCESETIAKPLYVYNDMVGLPIPPGSQFDTPPQGESSLTAQGVSINLNTGIIDLKKSLINGAFGQEGSANNFRLYYKLNDQSQFKLKFTHLIIYYFTEEVISSQASRVNNTTPERCTTVVIRAK